MKKLTFTVVMIKLLILLLFTSANELNAKAPISFIDLTSWKLTLPSSKKKGENAMEVKAPYLADYAHPEYFFVDSKSKIPALVFRAPCGGATTKNSKYPRCELREMKEQGKVRAAWQTDDDELHIFTMRAAITHTPVAKPHVVCAQIHDSKNDLIMLRLEGSHLFIERKPYEDVSIQRNYILGTAFDVKIQAGKGRVQVWYNGEEKMDWQKSAKNCYFKAGCYTQSNPHKGDKPKSYGEVKIYQLAISHHKAN